MTRAYRVVSFFASHRPGKGISVNMGGATFRGSAARDGRDYGGVAAQSCSMQEVSDTSEPVYERCYRYHRSCSPLDAPGCTEKMVAVPSLPYKFPFPSDERKIAFVRKRWCRLENKTTPTATMSTVREEDHGETSLLRRAIGERRRRPRPKENYGLSCHATPLLLVMMTIMVINMFPMK